MDGVSARSKGLMNFSRFLVVLLLLTLSCKSVYYSTWEKLGKYKRDVLQSKVKQVRDDQKETTEQLKDALTRLQQIYGFKGGEFEKMYRRLQSDYDASAAKAEGLKKRIREMDEISFMNRLIFREVLECASPLALWHQQ